MRIHSILGRRQIAIAAGATLAAGVIAAGPAEAASPSATVADGTLTILGTGRDDSISLDAGDPSTLLVDFGDGTPEEFDRTTFDSISAFLGRGDDKFQVANGSLAAQSLSVVGGAGNDTIIGSDGNDTLAGRAGDDTIEGGGGVDVIFGNSGRDIVNGNIGNDTEFLGRGQDEAVWNPGEGSDDVSGGGGDDTLTFNGSDGDETMSLSAEGGHAVFLREPGAVRMDLDHVEQLDLATFGGVDTVAVNNLARTDLRSADIDLSATAGGGDGKEDTVTVNGTSDADQIQVDADNGAVDVAGLRAETRIAGSESTDHLVVNSLAGNDQVDVSDAAKALIDIVVDLGFGQR